MRMLLLTIFAGQRKARTLGKTSVAGSRGSIHDPESIDLSLHRSITTEFRLSWQTSYRFIDQRRATAKLKRCFRPQA
jgi:hypothetical protein